MYLSCYSYQSSVTNNKLLRLQISINHISRVGACRLKIRLLFFPPNVGNSVRVVIHE